MSSELPLSCNVNSFILYIHPSTLPWFWPLGASRSRASLTAPPPSSPLPLLPPPVTLHLASVRVEGDAEEQERQTNDRPPVTTPRFPCAALQLRSRLPSGVTVRGRPRVGLPPAGCYRGADQPSQHDWAARCRARASQTYRRLVAADLPGPRKPQHLPHHRPHYGFIDSSHQHQPASWSTLRRGRAVAQAGAGARQDAVEHSMHSLSTIEGQVREQRCWHGMSFVRELGTGVHISKAHHWRQSQKR